MPACPVNGTIRLELNAEIDKILQDAFAYVGANIVGMVYGSADKPGEIKSNQDLMSEAEALGRKLSES